MHTTSTNVQFYNVHYSIFIAMRSSGSLERLHKYWPLQYCRNSLLFYMTICAITCLKLEHFKILHSFVIQKCINRFNQLHTLTLVLNKYHSLFPSVIFILDMSLWFLLEFLLLYWKFVFKLTKGLNKNKLTVHKILYRNSQNILSHYIIQISVSKLQNISILK